MTDWLALSRDGTVVFASATAQRDWVGRRLSEIAEATAQLRDAAARSANEGDVEVSVGDARYRVSVTDAVALHRAWTELPPLLAGTVEALQRQAHAIDASLEVVAAPDLPRVWVDSEKIAWAVATLVGNALRYVRHGTRRLPGGSIRVRLRAEERDLVISVEDDGPGIPQDKVAKLFRPTGEVTHGTGLALMLVRDVVAAHGGRVEVESRQDAFACGTTVHVRIPIAT